MIKGTLVSVKSNNNGLDITMGGIWEAFGMAILDIVDKKRQGRSVINISLGSKSIIYKMTFLHTNYYIVPTNKNIDEQIKLQYKKLVEDAEEKGIVVVTAAGNKVGTVILTRLSALYEVTI